LPRSSPLRTATCCTRCPEPVRTAHVATGRGDTSVTELRAVTMSGPPRRPRALYLPVKRLGSPVAHCAVATGGRFRSSGSRRVAQGSRLRRPSMEKVPSVRDDVPLNRREGRTRSPHPARHRGRGGRRARHPISRDGACHDPGRDCPGRVPKREPQRPLARALSKSVSSMMVMTCRGTSASVSAQGAGRPS
jgi:hypothetical protein